MKDSIADNATPAAKINSLTPQRDGAVAGDSNADGDPLESGGVTRACVYCKQDKAWINSGKKLKDGSKIYTDEAGARWSGRRCPSCERNRVYAAVRCDSFERDAIIRQFESQGYVIKSRTLPLKVEKDGQVFTVGIKRAYTDGSKIVLESAVESGQDLMALVFESVRICSVEQLNRLGTNLGIYEAPAELK